MRLYSYKRLSHLMCNLGHSSSLHRTCASAGCTYKRNRSACKAKRSLRRSNLEEETQGYLAPKNTLIYLTNPVSERIHSPITPNN